MKSQREILEDLADDKAEILLIENPSCDEKTRFRLIEEIQLSTMPNIKDLSAYHLWKELKYPVE